MKIRIPLALDYQMIEQFTPILEGEQGVEDACRVYEKWGNGQEIMIEMDTVKKTCKVLGRTKWDNEP